MKNANRYLTCCVIVTAIAWLLGVLRFSYLWAEVAFKALLFPLGSVYLQFEHRIMDQPLTNIANDEITQVVLFVLMILLQALIYFYLWRAYSWIAQKTMNRKIHI